MKWEVVFPGEAWHCPDFEGPIKLQEPTRFPHIFVLDSQSFQRHPIDMQAHDCASYESPFHT
jgi:hypothetical protein